MSDAPPQTASSRLLRQLLERLGLPQLEWVELVRFGVVGVTCAGIYFVLLWGTGRLYDLPMGVRSILAYGPSIAANYLLHRSFTFRSQKQHRKAGPRYLTIQLGGMLINGGLLWLGVDVAAWPYLFVQFGAIGVMALWSYLGQKFWAFS